MFYCICLDECYWTPRHLARHLARQFAHIPRAERVREADALAGVQFAHIPRPKVVRNADALAGVQF